MPNALQQMAERYLTKLYELSEEGLKPQIDVRQAVSEVGFSSQEMRSVHHYLESKDLISWDCPVGFIRLTPRAIDAMQNSYEVKETLVLRKIYDLSEQNTAKAVFFHVLVSELEMSDREVVGLCKGLHEQGLIDYPPDIEAYLYITRRGIEAIQSLGKPKHSGGDTYNTTFTSVQGGVQIGPGGTQNIQNVQYQPLSEILPHLTSLIEAVKSEQFDDRDEVVRDLEIAHQVALANPDATANDGAWTRIQTKLAAAKTTMELSGFVIKTYPYWPLVWDFFHRHIR